MSNRSELVPFTYLSDLRVGQLGIGVPFSSATALWHSGVPMSFAALPLFGIQSSGVSIACSHSALSLGIFNVLFGGAKKEMVWPNTSRVIAMVANEETLVEGADK